MFIIFLLLFRPYQCLILNSKHKISDAKDYVKEVLKYNGKLQLLSELEGWTIPRFPINGNMLKDANVPGILIFFIYIYSRHNYLHAVNQPHKVFLKHFFQ